MDDTQNKNNNSSTNRAENSYSRPGAGRFNRRHRNRYPRPPRPGIALDTNRQLEDPAADDADEAEAVTEASEENDTTAPESEPAETEASETSETPEASAPSESPAAPEAAGTPETSQAPETDFKPDMLPDLSAFDSEIDKPAKELPADDPDSVEVIGVRFKHAGKVYYFAPGGVTVQRGDNAIVETARGAEFGEVFLPNRRVSGKEIVLPLRPLIRVATKEDVEHNEQNRKKEKEAFGICLEKIAKHGLDMKLVDAQYTFDNTKLLFYFTSAGRVDFRELVKDLASVFRTRIELRQIGIRDEAKLLGGLGACGRPLCCSSFLSDFVQVSIKMAKEQNLSLNSNKISGSCGRLMCCLRYEYDTYVNEIKQTPPVESVVRTADGDGVVIEMNPLAGTIKVKLTDKTEKQDNPIKVYNRNDVKILSRPQINDRDKDKDKNGADTE
jgi:cell fate regulator YaaT (PSP1 superfamily)